MSYPLAQQLIQDKKYDQAFKAIEIGLTADTNSDKYFTLLEFANEMFDESQYQLCYKLCQLSISLSRTELGVEGCAIACYKLHNWQAAIDVILENYSTKLLNLNKSWKLLIFKKH